MIRKYTQQAASKWAEFLPLFEFAYNRSRHEQTHQTPFSVIYGEDLPVPIDYLAGTYQGTASRSPTEHAQQRREALQIIHKLLDERQRQQARQIKAREDSKRGLPQYLPGDEVLVYWPQFAPRTTLIRKQRLRYEGPFTILAVISDHVVKLKGLPERMSPLINVAFLHLYRRSTNDDLRRTRGEC